MPPASHGDLSNFAAMVIRRTNMYEPNVGERVKIIADTCGHAIARGSVVEIAKKRGDLSWYLKSRDVYVTTKDISRLDPSLRKVLRNLEKSVRQAVEEAVCTRPELKEAVRSVMTDITNNVIR
jgi:hypothetical protein